MSKQEKNEIENLGNSLMLVEGSDEVKLFKKYIKNIFQKETTILSADGVGNITKVIDDISKRPDIKNLKKWIIIVDKDTHHENPPNRFESITNKLKNLKRPLPIPKQENSYSDEVNGLKIGIFTMPGSKDGHMLEDLWFNSIPNEMQELVKGFFKEFDSLSDEIKHEDQKTRNKSKANVNVYLATFKYDKRTDNPWNLDHPTFDELKNFLEPIFEEHE